MNVHLLLTKDMYPLPEGIEISADWGNLTIVVDDNHRNQVTGLHCVVTGEEDILVGWLGKFDGFWKGNGSPMMESFEMSHIDKSKENAA